MAAEKRKSPLTLPANTPAWTFQCWAAFVLAMLVLTRGIYQVELDNPWVRGFLAIAALFTIGTSFTLSKTLRDNRDSSFDTPAWMFFAWASFVVSIVATFAAIYNLPSGGWTKGFFLAAFLFQINASFALSKTVRDNHESNAMLANEPVQP